LIGFCNDRATFHGTSGLRSAKRASRGDAVQCLETESLQQLKERSYES
jgi:hypothetical protein